MDSVRVLPVSSFHVGLALVWVKEPCMGKSFSESESGREENS